jgi:hypothetical protein
MTPLGVLPRTADAPMLRQVVHRITNQGLRDDYPEPSPKQIHIFTSAPEGAAAVSDKKIIAKWRLSD